MEKDAGEAVARAAEAVSGEIEGKWTLAGQQCHLFLASFESLNTRVWCLQCNLPLSFFDHHVFV